ncbi:MAG: ABC transporter permease subunit [Thermodesulfobacteriota bacterium]
MRSRRFAASRAIRYIARREIWIERVLFLAAGLSAAVVVAIFSMLTWFCLPLFTEHRLGAVLEWRWDPIHQHFGILPMLFTSCLLTIIALIVAFPLTIGICSLLHGVLRNGVLHRMLLFLLHFMTGIPTVIYGFVSVFVLVPLLRWVFEAGTGFSLLAAGLTLSVLILPTMVLVLHAELDQAEARYRLTAEALGFSPEQTIRTVLLPACRRALVVTVLLGMGRAVGDTLVSLMVAGNAAQVPHSIFDSVRTLTAHIALVLATDSHSMAYQSVFAAGLFLFLLMSCFQAFLRFWAKHGTVFK